MYAFIGDLSHCTCSEVKTTSVVSVTNSRSDEHQDVSSNLSTVLTVPLPQHVCPQQSTKSADYNRCSRFVHFAMVECRRHDQQVAIARPRYCRPETVLLTVRKYANTRELVRYTRREMLLGSLITQNQRGKRANAFFSVVWDISSCSMRGQLSKALVIFLVCYLSHDGRYFLIYSIDDDTRCE